MRNRYFLIFLTLVLLVVPSISLTVGGYPLPPGIKKGDIVLIQWKNKPEGIHKYLTWDHAMLYIGRFNGVDKVIHAWHGVENSSWSEAMSYNNDYGGVNKMVVVRLKEVTDPDKDPLVAGAVNFADRKWREGHPYYDRWSQDIHHLRKQVQPVADDWWDKVIPSSWIPWFTYNGPVTYEGRESHPANEYYCTELVWAAYFENNGHKENHRYLEFMRDKYAVSGWEIEHDRETKKVSGESSSNIPLRYDN